MTKVLRAKEVVLRTGLSRVTIWRRERDGDFPQRLDLGGGSVGWIEEEVEQWIESCPRGILSEKGRV